MKHLFLKDDELTFMVYYAPKRKAQLLELIFKREQEYWRNNENETSYVALLGSIIKTLQNNGFKCVEINKELDEIIDVYNDLDEESIVYRGITITQSRLYSSFSFQIGKAFYSLATLEEAIETIDKELR